MVCPWEIQSITGTGSTGILINDLLLLHQIIACAQIFFWRGGSGTSVEASQSIFQQWHDNGNGMNTNHGQNITIYSNTYDSSQDPTARLW